MKLVLQRFGRLLLPLARISRHVVGVDVSDAMLREARKHCDARGITNVELVGSDDRLSRVQGSFDFVHSWIVFQHIAPRRGTAILEEVLARLERGGRPRESQQRRDRNERSERDHTCSMHDVLLRSDCRDRC